MQQSGVDQTALLEYQKKLYNAGKATIPLSYMRFLKHCNGIQTDTLALFGVNPDHETIVEDIFERNSNNVSDDKIFLGDNFNEYLTYTWSEKNYHVLDKASGEEIAAFPYMEQAMQFFVRDHLQQREPRVKAATNTKVKSLV